jgi:hypothetical protein
MEKDVVFETAERYVKATGRSVFLTGKAGTGKTTFLKYITQTTAKRFVVLAPTGVAAINAGGSTIHSFFQLPLCPYLPDVKELVTEYQLPDRYRSLRKERIKMIRTLDLLIIDEISMVRADLLDAVDMTLRKYRRNEKPFGGVQLLMIGDAQQLSPVVKESERNYMAQVYPSPYFFHSKALSRLSYVTIELRTVYRQKDRDFLDILNSIRENNITSDLLNKLNGRYGVKPQLSEEGTEPIRLTTHNAQADEVNSRKLHALQAEEHEFTADISGDFPENAYPADESLILKQGTQVMFIRNDSDGLYYNGKIGKVEEISGNTVLVSDENGTLINVAPVEWPNIQYALNEESGEIEPQIVGTFRQLPLRVAWAITIHKSQGLTFDNVIIDAGSAFAFGQVYVALSRCRSLDGIVLESPISPSAIYSDMHVAEFNAVMPSAESVYRNLGLEERRYVFDQLRNVFDYEPMTLAMGWFRKVWKEKLQDVYASEYATLENAAKKLADASKVADTFRSQITCIERSPEQDGAFLKERLNKAAVYFYPILDEVRNVCSSLTDLEIDNKETKKKVKDASDELLTVLDISCRTLESIKAGDSSVETLCKIRTECLLEERTSTARRRLKKLESSGGVVNEELRERLQQWRMERFKKDNVPAYTIMHQTTLMTIASLVPKTKKELIAIKGFGDAKYKKYGEEILAICNEFDKDKS